MQWHKLVPFAAATLFAAGCGQDRAGPSAPDGVSPTAPNHIEGGGVSGAAFTTTNPAVDRPLGTDGGTPKLCFNGQDPQGGTNNCNLYAEKQYVWLSGGPVAAALENGSYYFAVLEPGGQPNPLDGAPKNLSDATTDDRGSAASGGGDAWTDRDFTVTDGAISYSGPHTFLNNKIRLLPYDDTRNPGGVYILAICSLADGYANVTPRSCKYDAFKVRDGTGTPNDDLDAIISIEESAINEVNDQHVFDIYVTAFGGTAPYGFNVTAAVNGTAQSVVCDPNPTSVQHCTLTVNSSVSATLVANAFATVTDAASGSVTVDTDPLTATDAGSGGSGPATKEYVDASISVTPTETNGIGEQHVFTITATAYAGAGVAPVAIAQPTYAITAVPSGTALTEESLVCQAQAGAVRTCTLTINSASAAVFTVSAAVAVTFGSGPGAVTVNRDTDPSTTAAAGPTGIEPAVKTYVAGQLSWNKVDSYGAHLAGAEFRVERIRDRFMVAPDVLSPSDPNYYPVIDCVASPCVAGAGKDQNPLPGRFLLTNLMLGAWVITETKAPTNYQMSTGPQTVVIDIGSLSGGAGANFINPQIYFGCTPGFWQGGAGSRLWNAPITDADWKGVYGQPFWSGQQFLATTMTLPSGAQLQGVPVKTTDKKGSTFLGVVGTGGTEDWARKAARTFIAAYLNASYMGADPLTGYKESRETIFEEWNAAAIQYKSTGSTSGLEAFHAKYDALNNLGCRIGRAG